MTEKELKEAIAFFEKGIHDCSMSQENMHRGTLLDLARTVLEAGEKIEFHAAPNNYTTIEKQYAECEHQAQDWLASDCIHCKFAVLIARARHLEETIQAVLPVVAKKDLIIAEQAKRIERLTGCLVQMIKYVREQHDNPKYTVSIYTPHLEDAEKTVAQIGGGD